MRRGALLLLLLAVAACGRVGPVRPPGPPEQVIYPRPYPAPDLPATLAVPAR